MIVNVPIEPIPMRYSVDWQKWFTSYFKERNIAYINILGNCITNGVEQGRFLDCIGTNYHKSSQLMQILTSIQMGTIRSGDVIFLHDLWFPGIEQIKYTCDAMNLDIKIMGCLHAGAYDPNDFLYQQGMGSWAIHFEHMLFSLVDKIFVATEYHKDLILKSRSCDPNKIKVTGFPFIPKKYELGGRENIIIFPHRHNPEKNPNMFYHMKHKDNHILNGWEWITTKDVKNKEEYYQILRKSKIAVSFADQETWGIAMQECTAAGCLILVPNKLSYKEMFNKKFRYDNMFIFEKKLKNMIETFYDYNYERLRETQANLFKQNGRNAFDNITKYLWGSK